MKVIALVSFSGIISMTLGEEADIASGEVLNDLLHAHFVEEIKTDKKKVKANESK